VISLMTLTIVLASAGLLVTALLAVAFVRDPEQGLVQTTHHLAQLPEVMADRYIAMTALAAGAIWFGHAGVIAFLFSTFAFMGFADAYIYRRVGLPVMKHIAAGIAAMIVVIVATLAQINNGAA